MRSQDGEQAGAFMFREAEEHKRQVSEQFLGLVPVEVVGAGQFQLSHARHCSSGGTEGAGGRQQLERACSCVTLHDLCGGAVAVAVV